MATANFRADRLTPKPAPAAQQQAPQGADIEAEIAALEAEAIALEAELAAPPLATTSGAAPSPTTVPEASPAAEPAASTATPRPAWLGQPAPAGAFPVGSTPAPEPTGEFAQALKAQGVTWDTWLTWSTARRQNILTKYVDDRATKEKWSAGAKSTALSQATRDYVYAGFGGSSPKEGMLRTGLGNALGAVQGGLQLAGQVGLGAIDAVVHKAKSLVNGDAAANAELIADARENGGAGGKLAARMLEDTLRAKGSLSAMDVAMGTFAAVDRNWADVRSWVDEIKSPAERDLIVQVREAIADGDLVQVGKLYAKNPGSAVGQAIETLGPSVVGAFATGGLSTMASAAVLAKLTARFGVQGAKTAAKVVPVVVKGGGTVATSSALYGTKLASEIRADQIKSGVEVQAADLASMQNTSLAMGAGTGLISFIPGVDRLVNKKVAGQAVTGGWKSALGESAGEALQEFTESSAESLISDVYSSGAPKPITRDMLARAAAAGTQGAILGSVAAGGMHRATAEATPGAPTPGAPTPGAPTPGAPTPGAPTPGAPTPAAPTPPGAPAAAGAPATAGAPAAAGATPQTQQQAELLAKQARAAMAPEVRAAIRTIAVTNDLAEAQAAQQVIAAAGLPAREQRKWDLQAQLAVSELSAAAPVAAGIAPNVAEPAPTAPVAAAATPNVAAPVVQPPAAPATQPAQPAQPAQATLDLEAAPAVTPQPAPVNPDPNAAEVIQPATVNVDQAPEPAVESAPGAVPVTEDIELDSGHFNDLQEFLPAGVTLGDLNLLLPVDKQRIVQALETHYETPDSDGSDVQTTLRAAFHNIDQTITAISNGEPVDSAVRRYGRLAQVQMGESARNASWSTATTGVPLSLDSVVAAVRDLTRSMPGNVSINVAQSWRDVEGLPDPGMRAAGVSFDGKVWIFAEGVTSLLDVEQTLAHELFHHAALLSEDRVGSEAFIASLSALYAESAWLRNEVQRWAMQDTDGKLAHKQMAAGSMTPLEFQMLGINEALARVAEKARVGKLTEIVPGRSAVRRLLDWVSQVAEQFGLLRVASWLRGAVREGDQLITDTAIPAPVRDFVTRMLRGLSEPGERKTRMANVARWSPADPSVPADFTVEASDLDPDALGLGLRTRDLDTMYLFKGEQPAGVAIFDAGNEGWWFNYSLPDGTTDMDFTPVFASPDTEEGARELERIRTAFQSYTFPDGERGAARIGSSRSGIKPEAVLHDDPTLTRASTINPVFDKVLGEVRNKLGDRAADLVGFASRAAVALADSMAILDRVFPERSALGLKMSDHLRQVGMSQAQAELTRSGLAVSSVYDLQKDVDLKLAATGLTAEFVGDWLYAKHTITQGPKIRAKFPRDAADRPNVDPTKMEFSVLNGRWVPEGTPGATVVRGPLAAQNFLDTISQQISPEQAAALESLAASMADLHHRVIDIEEDAGLYGPTVAKELKQQRYWVPLRNKEMTRPGNVLRKGRRTKAANPLIMSVALMQARTRRAYRNKAMRELLNAARSRMLPNVLTVNAIKLSPKSASGVGLDPATRDALRVASVFDVQADIDGFVDLVETGMPVGEAMIRWESLDPLGKDSLRVFDRAVPYRLTFNRDNPTGEALAKALIQDRDTLGMNRVLAGLTTTTRVYSQLLTTANPRFTVITQSVRDMLTVMFNAQGAADRSGSPVATGAAYKLSVGIIKTGISGLRRNIAQAANTGADNRMNGLKRSDVLMKQIYDAEGGGLALGARLEYDQTRDMLLRDSLNSEVGAIRRGAANGLGRVNRVLMYAHAFEESMRYGAFVEFLKLHNSGKEFASINEFNAFKRARPDLVAAAVQMSKEITTNFERRSVEGGSKIARSVIPFWNAAMQGVMFTIPSIISTEQGRRSLGTLFLASMALAFSQMGDSDDEDLDGRSKFLRKRKLESSWIIGDTAIPLPPELLSVHQAATQFAAAVMGKATPGEAAAGVLAATLGSISPVRLGQSDDFTSVIGLMPWMLQPATRIAAGVDAFGRPLQAQVYEPSIKKDGTRGADRKVANPLDVETGRSDTPEWIKGAAVALYQSAGIDWAPGSMEEVIKGVTGSLYWTVKDAAAVADGSKPFSDAMFSPLVAKPNTFAVADRFEQAERDILGAARIDTPRGIPMLGNPGTDILTKANEEIRGLKDSEGDSIAGLSQAIQGTSDPLARAGLEARRAELFRQRDILKGQALRQLDALR